jgi:hypothetical protein
MRPTVASLALLTVFGVDLAAAGWVFAGLNQPIANASPVGAFLTVSGLLLLGAGWLMVRRRPRSWTGPLLQLTAITGFIGYTRHGLGGATPLTGGLWLAAALLPGVLALAEIEALGVPLLRWLTGGFVAVTAGLGVAVAVAARGRAGANSAWWDTRTRQRGEPTAQSLFLGHTVVSGIALIAIFLLLLRALRSSDRASRRLITPVAVPGLVWAVVIAAAQAASIPDPRWAVSPDGRSSTTAGVLLLQIVPVVVIAAVMAGVVWVELIIPRLERTPTGIAIRSDGAFHTVEDYLARTLGDPSIRAVYRAAERPGWVDDQGRPTSLAVDDPDRGTATISRSGLELGAIEYDASLASEPDTVELILPAAALAIDTERLKALANVRAENARRLTARMLSSADSARDDVRRRVAQGPGPKLDAIQAMLEDGDQLQEVSLVLAEVASEVRRISHGLYPAELADGGLAAVLTEAAEVPAIRFPRSIEITAFLAADGDSGARIRREPGQLVISLTYPPNDTALFERVAVLGGTVEGSTITLPVSG